MSSKTRKVYSSVPKIPGEVKIVGALVLLLAALYVFQLISQPSFIKSQVKGVTGFIVADSSAVQSSQPAAATPGTVQKAPSPQIAEPPKPAVITDPIKITSPKKGSVVSPGFDVDVEVSDQVLTCYYLVKDSGAVTWDRRTKPCKTTFSVAADFCRTVGESTCYVYAEAADTNGNMIGTDAAYYSIK